MRHPLSADGIVRAAASCRAWRAAGADFATSLSDLRRYLEMVRRQGRFIDIFFHRIELADVAQFEQFVKVLAEYRDVIQPYDRLFPAGGRVER